MEIGGYRIEAELGRGGMGTVYRALDPRSGARVALKAVGFHGAQVSERALERLRREAQALSRLDHPGLAPCLASGVGPQGMWVAMPLVEGETIEALLERVGPLPVGRALQLMRDVGEALAYVHAQGLLHRDLKPSNVLLSAYGRVVLTDFGLVKASAELHGVSQASLTRDGAMLGTPGYWPPEQALGKLEQVGTASDVYGWAATFYALLSGRAPHDGRNLVELLGSFDQPVVPLGRLRAGVPAWLDGLLSRCLAADPAERPGLDDVLKALRPGAGLEGGTRGKTAVGVAMLAVAVLALGLGAAWFAGGGDPASAAPTGEQPSGTEPPPGDDPPTGTKEPPQGHALRPMDAAEDEQARAFRARVKHRDVPGALRIARAWAKDRPESCHAQQFVVEALMKSGKLKEALRLSEETLLEHPENATLWGFQGMLHIQLGDYPAGLVSARRATELDPENPTGVPALAYACRLTGDVPGALAAYDTLIGFEPSPVAHLDRGWLRVAVEDFDGALNDANLAVTLDETYAEGYALRGHLRVRHENDLDGVVDLERSLGGRLLNRVKALDDLCFAHDQRGEPEQILEALDRWASESKHPTVLGWRVTAHLALEDGAAALPHAQELTRRSATRKARADLGHALLLAGRSAEALPLLGELAKGEDEHAQRAAALIAGSSEER